MKSSPAAHRISAVQLPLSERDPKTQWSFSDTGAPRNMECRPAVRERASRTLGPEALFDQVQSNSPESNIFHWCLRRIRHSGEVKLLPMYRARAPPSHLFATGSPSTGVFLLRLNGCVSGGDHAALLRSPSPVTLRRVLWSYWHVPAQHQEPEHTSVNRRDAKRHQAPSWYGFWFNIRVRAHAHVC